jgi:hypothetical protein
MSYRAFAIPLAAALLAVACNGGRSSGPTAPQPKVSLLGHWSGPMRVDRTDGSRESCTLAADFVRENQGAFAGTYSVTCEDGRHQEGVVAAVPAGDFIVDGLQAAGSPAPALDGCSWEGQLAQLGIRLSGPWYTGGCAGSPILGGLIDLAKS